MYRYNSFTARFYRWCYDTEQMPKRGCVYFWRLFLASVFSIVFLPFTLVGYILFATVLEGNEDENVTVYIKSAIAFGIMLLATVAWAILGAMLYPLFYLPIFLIERDDMKGFSILFYVILGLVTLRWLYLKWRRAKRTRPSTKWIIAEAVKAVYEKTCPIIEWDYNSKKNKKKYFLED